MAAPRHERLRSLVDTIVTGAGFDLESVEVQQAGKRRLVRVVVDSDDGVSLDDVAELSRAISEVLDASDVMASSPYVLEVTSPGVDRPLTELRHWRRAQGRLVEVTRSDGTKVRGRVGDVESGHVVLEIESGSTHEVSFDEIGRAVVQVEFNRAGEDVARDHGRTEDDDEIDDAEEMGALDDNGGEEVGD